MSQIQHPAILPVQKLVLENIANVVDGLFSLQNVYSESPLRISAPSFSVHVCVCVKKSFFVLLLSTIVVVLCYVIKTISKGVFIVPKSAVRKCNYNRQSQVSPIIVAFVSHDINCRKQNSGYEFPHNFVYGMLLT